MELDVKEVNDFEDEDETGTQLSDTAVRHKIDTLLLPQKRYNRKEYQKSPRTLISRSMGADVIAVQSRQRRNLLFELKSINNATSDLRKHLIEKSLSCTTDTYAGGDISPNSDSLEDSSSEVEISFSDIEADCFSEFQSKNLPRYLRTSRVKFAKITQSFEPKLTVNEWATYFQWVKQIAKADLYENELFGNSPSLRQIIFIHFIKLEIPVIDIVKEKFGSVADWKKQGRIPYPNVATFLQVPLADDFSSTWWCSDYPIPNNDFGSSYICHLRQTYPEDKKRSKREKLVKEKKTFYKQMIHGEVNYLFESLDPKHSKERNRHIQWAIKWIISSRKKVTNRLRINCSKLIISLLVPVEKVEGLSEKVWESGAALTILHYAKYGQVSLHRDIAIDQLGLGSMIDRGSTGKVYAGVWKGKEIAAKICEASNVSFNISDFRFEVGIASLLNHPNISSCLTCNLKGPKYAFVTEFQGRGSLRAVLMDKTREITWKKKIHILYNIVKGMEYLHKCGIIHRDIKTPNILVGSDWSIKITDFGSSCILGLQHSDKGQLIGTTEWMAPEVIGGKSYDEKIDVYSFGITMWEVITQELPYRDNKTWEIPDLVVAKNRPSFQQDFPHSSLKDLTISCWHHSPKKRPSFATIRDKLEILCHKLYKSEPGFLLCLHDSLVKIEKKSHSEKDRIVHQSEMPTILKFSL